MAGLLPALTLVLLPLIHRHGQSYCTFSDLTSAAAARSKSQERGVIVKYDIDVVGASARVVDVRWSGMIGLI